MPPFARGVAGLFQQLAPRGVGVWLLRIDFAGGQLNEMAAHRIAILMLEDQGLIVDKRGHDDRARMQDVFTIRFAVIGQAHPIQLN